MELPRFYRGYKNKRFNYIPRYYDERKEELEKRKRRIEREGLHSKDEDFETSIIRGSFRHVHGYREKANRASAVRTVLIFLILLGFVILLFSL